MQTLISPPSVAVPPFIYERRVDLARRKAVGQMTIEELRAELLTSHKTGLPNRRAFDDAERVGAAAVIGMSDADGLKALNDAFGYGAGDQMLAAKADALNTAGVEAYHDKGDEFLYRANSAAELSEGLEMARAILRETAFSLGATAFMGADYSFGIGRNLAEAEDGLKAHKADREARGERARGELRGIRVLKVA